MRALDLHSSMERLKGFKALYLSVISKFTFQYGEIKSAGGKTYKVTYQHLHSSMERLKVLRERSKNNRIPTFTFQYGEIKRRCGSIRVRIIYQFTFQYGEIKRVRWKLFELQVNGFTFQYGEIKRVDCRKNGLL